MSASQNQPESSRKFKVKYIPNQLLDSTGHLLSEHKRPVQQQPLIKQRVAVEKKETKNELAEVVIFKGPADQCIRACESNTSLSKKGIPVCSPIMLKPAN